MLFVHKMRTHRFHCLSVIFIFYITVPVIASSDAVNNSSEPIDSQTQDLLMRGAKPQQPDAYLCTAYPLSDQKSYIYQFEALANAATVHHMILYGCDGEPYSTDPVWDCPSYCKDSSQTILFAWAKNAPPTILPKGVGFRIGKQSTVSTLVLQVHYARAFQKEEPADHSGIRIHTTHQKQPFVAGIFLLASGSFTIPPKNSSYPVDISCVFDYRQSIFPFAFRPHAHSLGKVITGYLYNGSYYQIGKGNPKWPQTFYPVPDKLEIKPGDILVARCTYDSSSMEHPVSVGSTGSDEMCNFYIMAYTDKSAVDSFGLCVGNNIPELTGSHLPSDVSVPLPPNPALEEEAKGKHQHGSVESSAGSKNMGTTQDDTWTQDLLMRGAKPDEADAYLCTGYPITEEEAYIYKFEALANASTAHHILVYGCDGEAFSEKPMWQCPFMCKNLQSTILFAWAKNAPPTVLPKDVGLRIGQRSPIKTIVLQVHYARVFGADEKPDHSGIRVYVTHKKQPFVAGIYFMGSSDFTIPPGQPSYPVDVSCAYSLEESMFPFAYRTHAHGLGKVIAGYQYNNTFNLIGKGNPQWPQAFYPVTAKIEVKPGDFLVARCTYDSTSMTESVSVGSTGSNEMCNFYIMFYAVNTLKNPSGQCNGNYVPQLAGDHIPKDASDPLPPNPELEEEAKGHHHSHHGGSGSVVQGTAPVDTVTLDLMMRGAKPDQTEAYLCTAYPVNETESYIYKFEAMADASTVHHMLLFGCDGEPYSHQPVWSCHQVCKSKEMIMYAWAKNAPPTLFPKGVGMRIGQRTQIRTIVLQVHYARSFTDNEPSDNSGIRIFTTHEQQPYVAGIYLMASSSFKVPPGNPSYPVDISCKFSKNTSIFPFLYRTHAHSLGKVITGYHFNGSYHEIGKGNPHWPQAFYQVKDKIEVKPGDFLAARCTYDSSSMNHSVSVGAYGNNEMCNLYIIYYTNSSEKRLSDECIGDNEPQLTGGHFPSDVSVPLPPNPALEEAAKGHHHQDGQTAGEDGSEQGIHFEHSLEFNSSWPSDKVVLGQIGGVATDTDGNVYIFHRGSREWNINSFSLDNDFMDQDTPIPEDVIVVLNSQGQLIRKFGAGQYFMPHGIEVDKDGNIWLTDVALHQVFKISRGEDKPSLILGHRFKHGSDLTSFCKPTDVAVLSTGEFFVSDGYCNGRVIKFSKSGTLIKAWGERDVFSATPTAAGVFNIPHSITVSEENQLVCVADRENGRVQCFDLEGNFHHIIEHPEFGTRLFAIEQSPIYGGVLYAVNGPSFISPADISVQGFTLDIKTGDILETWNVPQHLQNPHDVCVHSESQSVYVGELNPAAVWKLARPVLASEQVHVHVSMKPDNVPNTARKLDVSTTGSFSKDDGTDDILSVAANMTSIDASKTVGTSTEFTPTVLIGCLLVIPVVLLLVIILLYRAHNSGKLNCCGQKNKRVFSLQGILGNSHKGFDPLNTEESDHDSDHEEYMAPKKIKSKA